VALTEALVIAAAAGMDLATTYEAIRISSGNSFVHETEGQVILNGSRDISFTMDLVGKDLALFQAIANRCGVPVELSPMLRDIVDDARARCEWSPNVIRRLEDTTAVRVLAPGLPAQLIDAEPEQPGHEISVRGAIGPPAGACRSSLRAR
jgi:3-hydroxyisobutyrate dehydrogenase